MSTLLEQASLVLIPSGYKEDTVYSVIPSNGSGDLSFTRASNGTRINFDGLVEVCPWNLVTYSEDFSNGAWVKQNSITVTANTTTAPNGTLTADTLEKASGSGGSNYYYIVNPTNSFEQLTNFFYVKYKSGSGIVWLLGKNSSSFAFYDVINGTALSATSGMTTSIENVGNGWYKCIFSQTYVGAANTTFGVGLCLVNGTPNYDATTAPTQSAYIWGSQSNIGSTAKPYFPTTDRLNVPRLTYQNGGGGCPSLLLEPQRTNLLTYSQQIQNAAWNVIGGDLVVTGNAVISPDGTQNAGAITLANSANRYFVHNLFSITGGVAYTYSVYMKSASGTLQINMGGVNGLAGVLKTVTTEWQRFTYTFTPATTYSEYFGFDNRGAGSSTSGTLYFWGAQVEASSYATSYIPTVASSATRIADACFKTGISSLIGQTEGSVFVDVNLDARVTQTYFAISSSATGVTNYIGISFNSTNIVYEVVTAGVLQASGTLTNSLTGQFKLAIGYKANDFVFYANGTQISTDNSGTVPACNDIVLFNSTFSQSTPMKYNQAILFKTRLTNSELAQITTI